MNTEDKLNDPNGTYMPDHAPSPTEQELVLQCKIDGYKNLVKRLQSLLAAEMENLSLTSQAFYESDKRHVRKHQSLKKEVLALTQEIESMKSVKTYLYKVTQEDHPEFHPTYVVAKTLDEASRRFSELSTDKNFSCELITDGDAPFSLESCFIIF